MSSIQRAADHVAAPGRIDNAGAYLFRIAANLLWEHRMREKRMVNDVQTALGLQTEHMPFDLAVSSQQVQRFRKALDALPATPRAVLILSLRDGWSYEVIGSRLGMSVSMAAERQSFAEWLSESPVHIREHLAVTGIWGTMRADGSVIQLNTSSGVRVSHESSRRVIELPEGEAFFRVAADAHRPFNVVTPLGTVRAVGTFTTAPATCGWRWWKARYRLLMRVHARRRLLEMATAWMQRRLAFENERLDIIMSEFNRYNRQQMSIADAALLAYRINGVFDADEPGALTKYLQRSLNELVLRRKKTVSVF